jgi:hypothetical protein
MVGFFVKMMYFALSSFIFVGAIDEEGKGADRVTV